MSTDAGDDVTFETVDWTDVRSQGVSLPTAPHTGAFLVAATVLAAAFAYDVLGNGGPLIADWDPGRLDWLYALAQVAFLCYVIGPLVENRRMAGRYWRSLRGNRPAVASLVVVACFYVAGTFAPVLVERPTLDIMASFQPPVGLTIDASFTNNCVGAVSNGRCPGTWADPLGTDLAGKSMLSYVLLGTHVALKVALVSATIIVPIATAVGTVAAHVGGRVDDVLMRYVDVQQAIPAFLIYLVLRTLEFDASLFFMVVVFGLLSWGGMARLVRSEALQRREELYVRAAEGAGANDRQIVRRHVLPNVSSTVVTAVTLQIPTLILAEAALSFLDVGDMTVLSWGQVIATGMKNFGLAWWNAGFPLLALVVTVFAFSVLGDGLRDALDPRTE